MAPEQLREESNRRGTIHFEKSFPIFQSVSAAPSVSWSLKAVLSETMEIEGRRVSPAKDWQGCSPPGGRSWEGVVAPPSMVVALDSVVLG